MAGFCEHGNEPLGSVCWNVENLLTSWATTTVTMAAWPEESSSSTGISQTTVIFTAVMVSNLTQGTAVDYYAVYVEALRRADSLSKESC
jgi:bisphosphoglycerate-dependent phosphoglycerate mutase